jgi:hypothetical protein
MVAARRTISGTQRRHVRWMCQLQAAEDCGRLFPGFARRGSARTPYFPTVTVDQPVRYLYISRCAITTYSAQGVSSGWPRRILAPPNTDTRSNSAGTMVALRTQSPNGHTCMQGVSVVARSPKSNNILLQCLALQALTAVGVI